MNIQEKAKELGLSDEQLERLKEISDGVNAKMGLSQSIGNTVESLLDVALSFNELERDLKTFVLSCEWAFSEISKKKSNRNRFHKMRVGKKRF